MTTFAAMISYAPHSPAFRAANSELLMLRHVIGGEPEPASGAIRKAADGHFWATGMVGRASVRFLVDTGATAVALTPADAARLGLRPETLHYTSHVVTAAGDARAASIRLASLSVAGARIDDVDALVIEKGLDTSLLGMTYLGRLASFQATRQALTLQP